VQSGADSPDCSPIELALSKLKRSLRRAEARTQQAIQAIEGAFFAALAAITAADAAGWFGHCGSRPLAQTT